MNYWDTDTPTLLLHDMVTVTRIPCTLLVGHGYTSSLDTVISYIDIIVTWMPDTLLSHVHTSLLHMLTTWVYMHVLFLSSCHMNHCTYYMYYCSMLSLYSSYMIVSCYWYGYSRHWTWELLICDMWNPTSIVPVSRYIVPVSRYIILCYQQSSGPVLMLPVSCTVFVLVTLYTGS